MFKKITIWSSLSAIILLIFKYFYRIDIFYEIEYGNVDDFVDILFETIGIAISGLFICLLLIIVIKRMIDVNIKNPRKTAQIGLVSMLCWVILYFLSDGYLIKTIFCSLENIGLIIYFSIIFLRLNNTKININIANIFLILFYIFDIILSSILEEEYKFVVILKMVITMYFVNILFIKNENKILNNYTFLGASIIITIMNMDIDLSNEYVFMISIIDFINYSARIFIIPYFYNYYNLLKGVNKRNG